MGRRFVVLKYDAGQLRFVPGKRALSGGAQPAYLCCPDTSTTLEGGPLGIDSTPLIARAQATADGRSERPGRTMSWEVYFASCNPAPTQGR
jgi:hypothetical protein